MLETAEALCRLSQCSAASVGRGCVSVCSSAVVNGSKIGVDAVVNVKILLNTKFYCIFFSFYFLPLIKQKQTVFPVIVVFYVHGLHVQLL